MSETVFARQSISSHNNHQGIKMQARRETKRHIIAIQTMLRSNELLEEQRKKMENNVVSLRDNLNEIEAKVNKDEIKARREFVSNNKGLTDIFNAIWLTFLSYTTDGYLSKEGYSKFNHGIQIALVGYHSFDEVESQINNDWAHDSALFGPFNKVGFFDLLFETIETWTEIVDPTFYAAFAWSLLDSLADTNSHPPRLRPFREINCITKVANEAEMIRKYMKNKKIRSALALEAEVMERIPEVQKRLRARKLGSNMTDDQISMVEVLSKSASLSTNYSLPIAHDSLSNLSDSDDDYSHKSDKKLKENSLVSMKDLLSVDIPEEDAEEKEEFDDELPEEDPNMSLKDTTQAVKPRSQRTSTISFMEYVKARRNTRIQLNGSISGGSFAGSSANNRRNTMQQQHNNNMDLMSLSSGLSESESSHDSWVNNKSPNNNNNSDHTNFDTTKEYQSPGTGDGYNQYGEYNRYERKMSKRFEKFVQSGQKYTGQRSYSIFQADGSTYGPNSGGKRSLLNSSDAYEYKAIDINEVNRQLSLRGNAFNAANSNSNNNSNNNKNNRNSVNMGRTSINKSGDFKTLTARKKSNGEPAVDGNGSQLAPLNLDTSDSQHNKLSGNLSISDDISSLVSDSSLLLPSISSADALPFKRPQLVPSNDFPIISDENKTKKKKFKPRSDQFIYVSGNTIFNDAAHGVFHTSSGDSNSTDKPLVFQLSDFQPKTTVSSLVNQQQSTVHSVGINNNINSNSGSNYTRILTPNMTTHINEFSVPQPPSTLLDSSLVSAVSPTNRHMMHKIYNQYDQSYDQNFDQNDDQILVSNTALNSQFNSYNSDYIHHHNSNNSTDLGDLDVQYALARASTEDIQNTYKLNHPQQTSNSVSDRPQLIIDTSSANFSANMTTNGTANNSHNTTQDNTARSTGAPLLRPLSPKLRPISPNHVFRPPSPQKLVQNALNDKYNAYFPHGKYSEIVNTTLQLRDQPINNQISSYNHSRAVKNMKLAPMSVVNQYALGIVTKPMTIYDNIKVMKEIHQNILQNSAQNNINNSAKLNNLHILHMDNNYSNNINSNNNNNNHFSFTAPASLQNSQYLAGEMSTLAMQAIMNKNNNKLTNNSNIIDGSQNHMQNRNNIYSGNSENNYETKLHHSQFSQGVASELYDGFGYTMSDELSSTDGIPLPLDVTAGEFITPLDNPQQVQQVGNVSQLAPFAKSRQNSHISTTHSASRSRLGSSLSLPSLTNYTDIQYGRPLHLDQTLSPSLVENYTHNMIQNSMNNNNSSSDMEVLKNLKNSVMNCEIEPFVGANNVIYNEMNQQNIQNTQNNTMINARSQPGSPKHNTKHHNNSNSNMHIGFDSLHTNSQYTLHSQHSGASILLSRENSVYNHNITQRADVSVGDASSTGISELLKIKPISVTKTVRSGSSTSVLATPLNNNNNNHNNNNSGSGNGNGAVFSDEINDIPTRNSIRDTSYYYTAQQLNSNPSEQPQQLTDLTNNNNSNNNHDSNNNENNTANNTITGANTASTTVINGSASIIRSRPQSPTDSYNKISMKTLQIPNHNVIESSDHAPFILMRGSSSSPQNISHGSPSRAQTAVSPTSKNNKNMSKMSNNDNNTATYDDDAAAAAVAAAHTKQLEDALLHKIHSLIRGDSVINDNFVVDTLSSGGNSASNSVVGKTLTKSTTKMSKLRPTSLLSKSHSTYLLDPSEVELSVVRSKPLHIGNNSTTHNHKHDTHNTHHNSTNNRTHNNTINSNLHLIQTNAAIPWIPRGSLIPLDSDRSNHLLGWKEKNMLIKQYPIDSSKNVMAIKSQSAVRESFEQFVKAKSQR